MVAEQPRLDFAELLRRLRGEAKLTQEELAELAGLSPRSVSDLERGIHPTARKDTAVLLAEALSLAGPVRELFVAAARGKGSGRGRAGCNGEAKLREPSLQRLPGRCRVISLASPAAAQSLRSCSARLAR